MLAITLFALKINSVAQLIPKKAGFIASLYVGDLQIGYRHCNITKVGTEMQQCLTKVYKWAQSNGFIFSETKTKMMHFTTLPGLHINKPQLAIENHIIPYTNSIKFLGMIWDTELLWGKHIAKLKAECNKAIGMLRTVTTQKWRADQYSTLKIYHTYIRAKLDYGSPAYASAAPTILNTLNSIATEALRIATGAFKSTPVDTLHILANEKEAEV